MGSATRDLLLDLGQLLWLGFEGTTAPAALRREIAVGDVGAVVVFGRNIASRDGNAELVALAELNHSLAAAVSDEMPPLWIAVDQEGGRVQRVRAPATVWPPMLELQHAEHADGLAGELGAAVGTELAALGFHVDFAPVLDVHTNPANPIIGDRAFATTPAAAASRALAFARGLESAGIVGCGKHFPGHGDTATDSHLELPRLPHDLSRLERIELAPFAAAARAQLPMIMTAHVVFEALDAEVPATLSRAVITGLLKERLGFTGLVVSDDLDMKAIADHFGVGEAATRALRAGCDVLLLCRDRDNQAAAREALIHAGETDTAMRERIGRSAAAVRALKHRYRGRARAVAASEVAAAVGTPAHQALATRLARG